MPPKPKPKPPAAVPTLSATIRQVILTRKLSANAVAVAAGVPPTSVSRWLNHERGLGLETAEKLALALGLTLVETRAGLR